MTGRAKYTGDIDLPGMLVARVLRSPHAHARIVSIDTSKAEAVPGVRAVITYKDAPTVMVWGSRQYALNDRARYAGDAVAALAAVDAETADKALKLITVQYEVLPFVLDPEEALKPGAPQLFRRRKSRRAAAHPESRQHRAGLEGVRPGHRARVSLPDDVERRRWSRGRAWRSGKATS